MRNCSPCIVVLAMSIYCVLPARSEGPWLDTFDSTTAASAGSHGNATVRTSGDTYGSADRTKTMTAVMPVRTGGPLLGSLLAPANIALRVQGKADMLLPPTRLDSFVAQSGYSDAVYGDESYQGPPPYRHFDPIESGIRSAGLTTGHASDAPGTFSGFGGERSQAAIEQERILVNALIAQGFAYRDGGDLASGERLLSAALNIDPANAQAESALQAINPDAPALLNARIARQQAAH